MRRARNIVALVGLMLLTAAGSASADTYEVSLGDCEPGWWIPFDFFADPGMEATVDCDLRQVVAQTANTPSFAPGAQALVTLKALEGTTFERFEWVGGFHRNNCQWDVMLVSAGQVGGVPAFNDCDVDRWLGERQIDLHGADGLSLEVRCVGPEACPVTPPDTDPSKPAGAGIYIFRGSLLTVHDGVAPGVDLVGFGPAGGPWLRGVQPLRYEARDNTGIRETSLLIGGHAERHAAACDYTRLAPCPQGGGELPVDTTRLPDGVHPLTVEVVDSGSNTSSESVSAHIDNTAPERAQADVEGGSGWHRQNAFTVFWDVAPERYAPISAVHYRVCRAGTGECVRGSRAGSGIERLTDLTVPGQGEWMLEMWREDEAGNVDEQSASPPVHLRFDGTPPAVRFEPRELEDPRRVSAVITDGVSGVAGGEIQLRPAGGGGPWQSLPSRLDRGRLSAQIDEDGLAPGAYELRAVARDLAGNEGATHTLPDGSAAVLRLPLRARARLTAGIVKTRAKRKPRLLPSATVAFGKRLRLSGRLTNQDGRPESGARLYVYSRSRIDARERFAGAVSTNRAGEFSYRLRARSSGTVRILYQGSPLLGRAERKITVEVPAASRLKVNARKVLNGDEVVFTGRLRGGPFPRPGKIIHLQAHNGREGWANFGRPVRAEPNGRWRIPYRFENTRGLVKYRFRVLVPEEANYPYETGASNTVRVTVRGR